MGPCRGGGVGGGAEVVEVQAAEITEPGIQLPVLSFIHWATCSNILQFLWVLVSLLIKRENQIIFPGEYL